MEMEKNEQMKEPAVTVKPVARSNPMVKAIILPDVLLVVQFILGMFNNFYVKFPDKAGPLGNWKFVLHSAGEIAHIVVGLIILVTVLMTVARAVRMKNRHMMTVATIGLVAVLLAIIGGVLFVTTQVDVYSYLMSIGFLVAILNVNVGILTFVPPAPPQS